MPQGGRRKTAFSGKQKKQQLKAKKERQQSYAPGSSAASSSRSDGPAEGSRPNESTLGASGGVSSGDVASGSKFFESRPAPTRSDAGRYALMFRAESKQEILRLKEEARKTIHHVAEEYLECEVDDFFTPELDFPIRPPWQYNISREQLERHEQKYFSEYLKNIDSKFEKSDLSYFELNLETWRQFWRVLEMSDILLCIVDMRYPPLLFPPKLYEYAGKQLGKQIVIVLNKIDLCPAPLVLAWKVYFKTKYPELETLCFTSFPSYNMYGNVNPNSMKGQKRRGRMRMAAEGALELYKVCDKIVQGQVDLTRWKEKIMEEMNTEDDDDAEMKIECIDVNKPDTGFFEFKKFEGGILTIGCIGQPNVGKSSLINAVMGRKVVSVSKTPGHTKHFQTIFLTPNVRLCDCPGLIFPSKVPKPLQVLCGSYPIAQLREPYSTVKYLGERLDLPRILNITHPEGDTEWCAFDIADGWAQKRGYYTAKASRLDSYRGANHLLRLALDGRICLCLRPPGFTLNEGKWNSDTRIIEIEHIQAKSGDSKAQSVYYTEDISDDDEDEEQEKLDDMRRKVVKNTKRGDDNEAEDDDIGDEGDDENEDDEDESDEDAPIEKLKENNFSLQNKFAMLNEDE